MSQVHVAYSEEQRPCLVAIATCGCRVAAYALTENMGIADNFDFIRDFIKEAQDYGASFEIRPLSFVRNNGLTFNCRHRQ